MQVTTSAPEVPKFNEGSPIALSVETSHTQQMTTHSTYYTMISHTFVQGDLHRGTLDRGRAFDGEDKFSWATADLKSHYLCLQTLWGGGGGGGVRVCVCVCVCVWGGPLCFTKI